jgi:hypothetical protein
MKENWYALYLCIRKRKTPDEALRNLRIKPKQVGIRRGCYKNNEISKVMYKLSLQGLTYKEIGQEYGLDEEAIRLRIYRYKRKLLNGEINFRR